MRSRAWTTAGVIGLTVLCGSPRAQAAGLEVTRADAPDCPSESELRAAIAQRSGKDPFAGSNAPAVRVDFLRVAPTSGSEPVGFSARIVASDGERTLKSDALSCASLGDAVAFAVAVLLREQENAPPSPPPPKEPEAPSPAPPPTEAAAEGAAPPRAAVFAGVLALVGVLPRAQPAPAIEARVRMASRLLASAGLFYAPATNTPDGSFAMSLAAAKAGACWEGLAGPQVSAGPCAHVVAGNMSVTSAVSNVPNPGDALYLGGLVGARASFRVLGAMALEFAADAAIPFGRLSVVTSCGTTPYEPPRVGGVGFVGVGASFL